MNDLIEGRRGLGKSTLAECLALRANPNLVVFDANNQFRNARVRTSDLEIVKEHMEMSEATDEPFFLSYIPGRGDIEEKWSAFASVIWNYGDYSLIVDEAHRLQSPHYINEWLDQFIRQAPRRERGDENPIDIFQTVHRPTDVNGDALAQIDFAYIFRQTKKKDIDYLQVEYSPEVAEAVQQLRTPETKPPGRDVVKYNVVTGEYVIITDEKEWFVNIRQTGEKAGHRRNSNTGDSFETRESVRVYSYGN